ncbi:hypothetical protein ACVWXO_002846 [Bradyrhizobium sp. LM2.7]
MQSDDQIGRLKDELWDARHTILRLAPDQFHEILEGYDLVEGGGRRAIETRQDLRQWERDLYSAVIEAAERIEHPEPKNSWMHEHRVACPLCRSRGSGAFYMDGWKVPGGLEMHLEGAGRTEHCSVTKAAYRLMLDRHREKFEATELATRQQLAERKKTEPVVQVRPDEAPELLFEPRFSDQKCRTPEQLTVIEDRLREIGFEVERNDNVVTYRRMSGDTWMVLADPRRDSGVEFELFKRSGKYRWNGLRRRRVFFSLPRPIQKLAGKVSGMVGKRNRLITSPKTNNSRYQPK